MALNLLMSRSYKSYNISDNSKPQDTDSFKLTNRLPL